MKNQKHEVVGSVEKLEATIECVKEAQKKFVSYTQEQFDKIFLAAATAANKERISFANLAVSGGDEVKNIYRRAKNGIHRSV